MASPNKRAIGAVILFDAVSKAPLCVGTLRAQARQRLVAFPSVPVGSLTPTGLSDIAERVGAA